jgi:hypothetical protein
MEHYVGIDVSLEQSSVCVADATGKIVREVKVANEPEMLVRFFRQAGMSLTRTGLEATVSAQGELETGVMRPLVGHRDLCEAAKRGCTARSF